METYTAHHSETVEELLHWPWKRFERFYEAYVKREIAESLERRRDDMISALWANSNYDDDKGTRKNAIEEITNNFDEAIAQIFGAKQVEEDEIDDNNPFFQAAQRGQEKLLESVNYLAAADDDTQVKEVVDYAAGIDQ